MQTPNETKQCLNNIPADPALAADAYFAALDEYFSVEEHEVMEEFTP